MINPEYITPVDLKMHRKKAGLTQAGLAERLHITRVHATRVETGRQSISFPLALACTRMFGSLTVSWKGEQFKIAPADHASTDNPGNGRPKRRRVPSDGMTLGEKIVRVSKEGRELLAKTIKVNKYLVMLHRNPEAAAEFGGEITKELADVLAWGEDLMDSLHDAFDAAYHEAEGKSADELAVEMGVSA